MSIEPAEEGLGRPRQSLSPNPTINSTDKSLDFLETFQPFVIDEKTGSLRGGNIPQDVLINNWDLLNQHLALGNMDKREIELVYLMAKRNTMTTIATIPKSKFSLSKLAELQKVKMASFLLSTKSKSEGGRDRILIPASVTLTEARSVERQEASSSGKQRRFGGVLNPLNWMP